MSPAFTIVGLGESLFDVFPDQAILGGAPLNVAYHAHQVCSRFGGRGVVASAVGTDPFGRRLQADLSHGGLTTEFVQVDAAHPTGRVDIVLRNGEPTYTFLDNTAWDHLKWTPQWQGLAETCDAVVFGTLAQRSPVSRATVQRFVETAQHAIRLFDVNLRVNFFDAESLRRSVELATAIKLNEDELPVVSKLLGISQSIVEHSDSSSVADDVSQQLARRLLDVFAPTGLTCVVLTRGSRGTELLTRDECVSGIVEQFPRDPQADNVGAGDACSAGLLWGWLNGWTLVKTVNLANRLGAFVASRPGATPPLTIEVPM